MIGLLCCIVRLKLVTNGFGGQTEYLYLLACSVIEGSDLSEIYDSVAGSVERYNAALGYVEMVSEQDTLGEEQFFTENVDDVDYREDTDHSRSWEWGYSRGYDDGWANLEYDDNPAKYEEEIENAEDYMAGYESGYMTAQFEAINH